MTNLRTILFSLAVASSWAFVGVAPVATQTLQLDGGRVLLGKVEQADTEGLRVKRLDNGGVLELRWDHLTPECARRLQEAHGLVSDEEGEPMVEADVVSYTTREGAMLEVIGRIVERGADALVIEKKGGRVVIPRDVNSITGTRRTQVPASQIYTDEQFYAMMVAEHSPGEDADKHAVLGDALMQARNYARALEHLERADELGGGSHSARLPAMIARVKVFQKAAGERELLDQIRTRRQRGGRDDFDKGDALIAEFEKEHKDSPLRPEFEKEKKRFKSAQQRFLVSKVAAMWSRLVRDEARRWLSANRDASLAAARQFAESEMSDAIAGSAATKLELPVEDVQRLFQERAQMGRSGAGELHSYGWGSWVLGADGVIKDTNRGESQDQSLSPAEDRELERLASKLRQARERAQRATRNNGGGGGGEQKETPESWWSSKAESSDKMAFLQAYYAEFSGDFTIDRAKVRSCVNCSGAGSTTVLGADGKQAQTECQLCHGTKYTRSVVVK